MTAHSHKAVMEVVAHRLEPGGAIPNHPRWPLLHYANALSAEAADLAASFEVLFGGNDWPPAWRNGVYPFHHFHCAAHEALGVYSGEVTLQFGGENGVVLTARPGDVVVLPAGTGHKKLASRGTLGIVGAYPSGQSPDMCTPRESQRSRNAEAIARVPLPACDPVYGAGGPLFTHWKQR